MTKGFAAVYVFFSLVLYLSGMSNCKSSVSRGNGGYEAEVSDLVHKWFSIYAKHIETHQKEISLSAKERQVFFMEIYHFCLITNLWPMSLSCG